METATTISFADKRVIKRFFDGETNFKPHELYTEFAVPANPSRVKPLVVHLLESGHRFSEDEPEALTMAVNDWDVTAFCYQIQKGWRPVRRETAFLRSKSGHTVAHEMVGNGCVFEEDDYELMCLDDARGWSIAHAMGSKGYIFKSVDVMLIEDNSGRTVAETICKCGYDIPKDHPIWNDEYKLANILNKVRDRYKRIKETASLEIYRNRHLLDRVKPGVIFTHEEYESLVEKTDYEGMYRPLAHTIAFKGYVILGDVRTLSIRNGVGNTTAHILAGEGYKFPEDHECLGWKRNSGYTVAHDMASGGYEFSLDNPVLYYAAKNGTTVAHTMAMAGFNFPDDHPAFMLQDCNKITVAYAMFLNGCKIRDDHPVLLSKNCNGISMAHMMAAKGYIFGLDSDILFHKYKDANVAEIMAAVGFNFPVDHKIFDEENPSSISIVDSMLGRGFEFPKGHWANKYVEEKK